MPTGFVKRGSRAVDLTGRRFGRLTVLKDSGRRSNAKILWDCVCDCGKTKAVQSTALLHGVTRSCGCLQRELAKARAERPGDCGTPQVVVATHRRSSEPIYAVYQAMVARCYNPNSTGFHKYGGRGITVCDEWRGQGGFERFLADMGEPPSPSHSIERVENGGPYSPSNCVWATKRQQSRNRRNSLRVLYQGRMRLLIEIAEEVGVAYKVLHKRIKYQRLTIEQAVSKPLRSRHSKKVIP